MWRRVYSSIRNLYITQTKPPVFLDALFNKNDGDDDGNSNSNKSDNKNSSSSNTDKFFFSFFFDDGVV